MSESKANRFAQLGLTEMAAYWYGKAEVYREQLHGKRDVD